MECKKCHAKWIEGAYSCSKCGVKWYDQVGKDGRVYLGQYWQGKNRSVGKTPIEWMVLQKKVLCCYCLAYML